MKENLFPKFEIKKSLVVLWFSVTLLGCLSLFHFLKTPGQQKEIKRWPAASTIQHSDTRPTLIVFFHPQCSCSDASLKELSLLLEENKNPVEVKIVFVNYPSRDKNWHEGDLYKKAASLQNVKLVFDNGGQEAERIGALTSGASYLVDETGKIVFQGGMTTSRGHSGRSPSYDFILEWLKKKSNVSYVYKIFGCEL